MDIQISECLSLWSNFWNANVYVANQSNMSVVLLIASNKDYLDLAKYIDAVEF